MPVRLTQLSPLVSESAYLMAFVALLSLVLRFLLHDDMDERFEDGFAEEHVDIELCSISLFLTFSGKTAVAL